LDLFCLLMMAPKVTIVLANLMNSKGELNAESIARIDLAAKLDSEFRSDFIMLCGWAYRTDCPLTIAEAMNKYILSQYSELAKRAVCQDLSRDTVGDAVFTRLYLHALFVDISCVDLIVITSDYHVGRAQQVFDFILGSTSSISVKGVPGFSGPMSETKERQSLAAFRHTFSKSTAGDLDSIYFCLRNRHPFYDGTIYPRIEDLSTVSFRLKSSLHSL